ncbi:carbon-nitrogen hydrolase [Desulfuromonas versatilis]|uniref:Carbon-nitrogen hydrolase n=1 Tax=Desulfuromonas versatilis TaxID=2802975 RepID=A0ABM8HXB7_9BACT|nr:carbon-nitrogen family hydrolase [Desulfuromonas versatilis]BCR06992.1 carbon-nitrogen hydrolase [Desulfuromonas versatilis]
MERKVCAAAVQFNIELGEVEANLQKALAGIRRVREKDARLVVLPEMWSSGYAYKRLAALAEETPRVLEILKGLTAEKNMVTVGSLPEKVDGRIYNTAFVVDNGRIAGRYRKLHLFSTMGEDRFLAAGDAALVVSTSVGRLGVAICYDLRFPELFRKLALEGAEILCVPAEWPKPRQEHWRTLLRARAIENQLFVAAANCCGIQGKLDFFGMSLLISPRGEILAEGGETETELSALFNFEEMTSYRSQIRCYQDRRPEIYGTLP